MISKNKLKYYSLLREKKYRDLKKQFIAEGLKTIAEGLKSSYSCETVLMTDEFETANEDFFNKCKVPIELVNKEDFNQLSDSLNPQGIAAIFNYPKAINLNNIDSRIIVCLDNITEPASLGTVFRNCDWFGIKDIVLSSNNADPFCPATVRSSMGSVFHLNIYDEADLYQFLQLYKKKGYNLLCADTEGEDIYSFHPDEKNIMILSSETHGLTAGILRLSDHRIAIPKYNNYSSNELLNVASSSAVILSCLAKLH
jgi:RNA methyltransferase, TrmH family